jgi:hypothetical protein
MNAVLVSAPAALRHVGLSDEWHACPLPYRCGIAYCGMSWQSQQTRANHIRRARRIAHGRRNSPRGCGCECRSPAITRGHLAYCLDRTNTSEKTVDHRQNSPFDGISSVIVPRYRGPAEWLSFAPAGVPRTG